MNAFLEIVALFYWIVYGKLRIFRSIAVALFLGSIAATQTYAQTATQIVVDCGTSLGTYKRFWGGLGQASFNEGVLGAPNRLYFNLIKEANSNGRQAFQFFRSTSMLDNNLHKSGEEIGAYVYSEDENGNPQYYWDIVDQVCDVLLASKLKPIINFSFMPAALASDPERLNPWFDSNVSPPRDYDKWRELAFQVVKHLEERYGAEEIESWYFEVWNEPDLATLFWISHPDTANYPPRKSDYREYYKLYDYTVDGAIRANSNIRIGGPAIAGDIDFYINKWMPHLLNEINYATGEVGGRLDFVSRHTYGPTEKIIGKYEILFGRMKDIGGHFGQKMINGEIDFVITEAGPMAGRHPWQNSRYVAAWIVKLVHAIFYLGDSVDPEARPDVVCFWTKPLPPNFTNHFGIATRTGNRWDITDNDVVKRPSFNAFEALSFLGNERISFNGPQFGSAVNGIATRQGNHSIVIVLYHLKEEDYENDDFQGDYPVTLTIKSLPFSNVRIQHYAIDKTHSNAYQHWIAMGKPDPPSQQQIAFLQSVDDLEYAEPVKVTQVINSTITKEILLQHNSVSLIVLNNADQSDLTSPEPPTGVEAKKSD